MPKGNRTNHKSVYARQEDLRELKERFFDFLDKDFAEVKTKLARQEGAVWIILILLGAVITRLLGVW
jgi:hypothetical protein